MEFTKEERDFIDSLTDKLKKYYMDKKCCRIHDDISEEDKIRLSILKSYLEDFYYADFFEESDISLDSIYYEFLETGEEN